MRTYWHAALVAVVVGVEAFGSRRRECWELLEESLGPRRVVRAARRQVAVREVLMTTAVTACRRHSPAATRAPRGDQPRVGRSYNLVIADPAARHGIRADRRLLLLGVPRVGVRGGAGR